MKIEHVILAGSLCLVAASIFHATKKQEKTMSKLSDTLNGLADQVEATKTSLDAFIATVKKDELSTESQAALDRLSADVTAIGSDVTAAGSPPA
jgi:uncharacterized protein YoxC